MYENLNCRSLCNISKPSAPYLECERLYVIGHGMYYPACGIMLSILNGFKIVYFQSSFFIFFSFKIIICDIIANLLCKFSSTGSGLLGPGRRSSMASTSCPSISSFFTYLNEHPGGRPYFYVSPHRHIYSHPLPF